VIIRIIISDLSFVFSCGHVEAIVCGAFAEGIRQGSSSAQAGG
jgi:hypothetical protein